MGKIGNLFNNEDLDIKDVLDQYESMQLKQSQEAHNKNNGSASDKTKPIKIDLEDRIEDTPNSYINNNKTIVLDRDEEKEVTKKQHASNENLIDDSSISFQAPINEIENNRKLTKTFKTVTISTPNTPNNQKSTEVSKSANQAFGNVDLEVFNNIEKETRILFNEPQAIDKKDLTREINDADNIIIEDKSSKNAKRESKRLAKVEHKEQKRALNNKIPKFVRFEIMNNKFKLYLSGLFLLGCIGGLSYLGYAAATGIVSFYLFIPFGLIALFFACMFSMSSLNFLSLKKELKLLNHDVDNEKPLSTIKKIYKHLITANINLNWICGSLYVLLGFAVLITYIVTYFINLTAHGINNFGLLAIANLNITPAICVYTFAGVCGFMLIYQLIYNIVNRKRKNDIEIFYKDEIYPEDTQLKLRKSANIRGGIIFAVTTIFIGFIVAITYFVLKRRPQKIIKV